MRRSTKVLRLIAAACAPFIRSFRQISEILSKRKRKAVCPRPRIERVLCLWSAVLNLVLIPGCGSGEGAASSAPSTTVGWTVKPGEGPLAGGTRIRIGGMYFPPVVRVMVGENPAGEIEIDATSRDILCTTPSSNTVGPKDVVVWFEAGSSGTVRGGFVYNPAPTLAGVTPSSGPAAGGQRLVIDGANFGGIVTVSVAGLLAADVAVNQDKNQISCRTTASIPQSGPILVDSTVNGTVTGLTFTYNATPSISSINPAVGPCQGGTPVTIDGAGFGGTVNVTIGTAPATVTSVDDAIGRLTCVTGASFQSGPASVLVDSSTHGTALMVDGFTYNPTPSISRIEPTSGPVSGNTLVSIFGSEFYGPINVKLGEVDTSSVTIVSPSQIDCRTPSAALPGIVDVTVRSSTHGTVGKAAAFRYMTPPTAIFARFDGEAGIEGAATLGHGLRVADLNGDGVSDLILPAYGTDFNGLTDRGSVYVIFGSASTPSGVHDLARRSSFNTRFDGAAAGEQLGNLTAEVGDVDGDGHQDLVLGASMADKNGRMDSGSVYVVLGGPSFPTGVIDLGTAGSYYCRFDGAASGDSFGSSSWMGDLNGDGRADLVFGALADFGGLNSGSVYVKFGPISSGTYDVTETSAWDARFDGAGAWHMAGHRVCVGDVNADGVQDLVIGAPLAGYGGASSGTTYVKFGPITPGTFSLATAWDIRYDGEAGSYFGARLSSGDVSGDGLTDLLIGAPVAGFNGRPGSGSVYLVRGGVGIPTGIISMNTTANYSIRYDGAAASDSLGWESCLGDVTGDNVQDMILGSRQADFSGRSGAGLVYVIPGGPTLPSGNLDLATPLNFSVRYGGAASGDNTGQRPDVGDVNGDGKNDLILGAWKASPGGRTGAGLAYVILGPLGSSSTQDLADPAVWSRRYDGPAQGNHMTVRFSAVGDLTGDGVSELVAMTADSDFNDRQNSGVVYVIKGGSTVTEGHHDLSDPAQYLWRFDGPQSNSRIHTIYSGDVNGDHIADLAIGTRSTSYTGIDSGSVYVIFGGTARPPGNYDLAQPASYNWRFDGEVAGGGFGWGLSIGDLDGDGCADLLVGALMTDFSGVDAGSLYVIPGSSTRVDGNYTADGSVYRYRFDGAAAGHYFGYVPSMGDFDGDGRFDLSLPAVFGDAGGAAKSGSLYVVRAVASKPPGIYPLANPANWDLRFDGVAVNDTMDHHSAVGDANNDGVDDILMGSLVSTLNGRTSCGSVYIRYGGSGLANGVYPLSDPASYSVRFDGPAPNANLGKVSIADVDNDGCQDIILTAGNVTVDGVTGAGQTYVFFGKDTPLHGNIDLASGGYDRVFCGSSTNDWPISSVKHADVTGDGLTDLIFCLSNGGGEFTDGGSLCVIKGPIY